MTHTTAIPTQKSQKIRLGQIVFGAFTLFCLGLILRNPDIAVSYVSRGLRICAVTVIPSLFPFMVLSEILVSGEIVKYLPKPLLAPLRHLLGLSDVGCSALLLGMLCGFPVGARCAVLSLQRGEMSRAEAERVLTCANVPSSAFLVSAVGLSLFQNRAFGVALYGIVLLSALITGFLFRLRYGTVATAKDFCVTHPKATCFDAKLFTDAIASATKNILLVSAYVIFFSALMGTLHIVLGTIGVSEPVCAFLFCLLELSGGISRAAGLGQGLAAQLLSAFAAGWSGLSVHCQVLSICDGSGLSLRPYFAAKLLQAVLCLLLFALFAFLFPSLLIPADIC